MSKRLVSEGRRTDGWRRKRRANWFWSWYCGYGVDDIARVVGCSERTVRRELLRAFREHQQQKGYVHPSRLTMAWLKRYVRPRGVFGEFSYIAALHNRLDTACKKCWGAVSRRDGKSGWQCEPMTAERCWAGVRLMWSR